MIETERLVLRPWREADKPAYAAMVDTPAMTAHLGGVTGRAVPDAFIDAQIAMQARHGFSHWAVERRAEGDLIGICGLRYTGHPGTPVEDELEIGWRIAEDAWGRGYAREAAQASLAFGWANSDRARIVAWTTQANRASWGLMLRLGMQRRPDLDFDHARFPEGHPVRRQIVYAIERPA